MKKVRFAKIFPSRVMFVLVLLLLFSGVARAEFPDRPITLMVAFDPGSTSDIIARIVAVGAEKHLGQRLVVENKAGGAGAVALALVANAKPDGYTICSAPTASLVYVAMLQKVNFKPLKSFTPLVGIAFGANTATIVRPDSPFKTFQQLVDYAKKNPGKIKYSTSGVGSGMHAAMEVVAAKEKIKWVHIPYKSAAQARMAVMGGHVDVCSAGAEFVPFARQGEVRVLATHGPTRSPQFPDAPTIKELGYDFEADNIYAMFAPAGLPADPLKKLETAFAKAILAPEVKVAIEKLDCTVAYRNSHDFDKYLKELWPKTEKMFKEAGIIKEPATQPY
jgi:tripartite-type tricarboxylate transporter receptor subunit TctC